MNENEYLNSTQSGAYAAEEWAVAQRKLMRNVYWWMTLAMALTGLVAYEVAASASIMTAIFTNNLLFYGLLIGELALVFILSARIEKLSFNTAAVMFALYSLINGATLSVIFVAYTASSIASTFFVTAGMFAAMAMVGSFTKRDLSGFGRFLLMALFGLIIAGIVQIFWQNSTFNLIVSGIGVLLFSALTAYDAQKIKRMLANFAGESDDSAQKVALLGALSLYLDFINLFLYLLRFLGNRR
ncbi:MAG: Bax inhibitor-1/YccA family protein [Paludibacteraceae bacterium]|nr:Bax inhibitor-1/YccA family protein [Paludibacteraceae bacterium]